VQRVERAVLASGAGEFLDLEVPQMATDDFSRYLTRRPGAFILVGMDKPGGGAAAPLHSAEFDFDEAVLAPAMRMMVGIVADFFGLDLDTMRELPNDTEPSH
jgi:hippurate hydrolase